ncbi:restriction endonuclease subunit S [Pelovirga terrestris]|nr:restriction endonuclease subunit S [Pelovirga terrestris]
MKLTPYPEYKDSGSPAAPNIPGQWAVHRCRYLFQEVDERSKDGQEIHLSMSQKHGLIDSSKIDKWRLQSESYAGGKVCQNGDLVLNRLKAHLGVFAHAKQSGVVSPDYTVLRPVTDDNPRFFEILFKSPHFITEFTKSTKGIVKGFWRLYTDDFYSIRAVVPPPEEQQQILKFIDSLTARANKFIRNKRRLIELLKEQKQNVINQAVTRGLDPNVKFKPSGVEWIGDIPEHWEVRKLKHIAAMKSGDNLTSDQIAEAGAYPVYGGNGLRGYFTNYNKDGKYLLVGRQGALCGNVHRVEGKFWATEHAVVTDVRSGILTDWYYYMLAVMNLNQYSESAAQPGISVEKIQNLRTALPSLEEQEAIVSHIERETATIDYTISRAQREIELMREYRTRLIADVVTGQVDVRGIEVPEVAEDELLALEEDTADADDVIDDEGDMDETD